MRVHFPTTVLISRCVVLNLGKTMEYHYKQFEFYEQKVLLIFVNQPLQPLQPFSTK